VSSRMHTVKAIRFIGFFPSELVIMKIAVSDED
jgi:hypothetical protein